MRPSGEKYSLDELPEFVELITVVTTMTVCVTEPPIAEGEFPVAIAGTFTGAAPALPQNSIQST